MKKAAVPCLRFPIGDIAILTKYLKTQDVSKAVIEALEGLRGERQETWNKTIEDIEELLEG